MKRRIPSIKRIYDPPEPGDGTRVLVDRLWPRGVRKEGAPFDLWLKEIAPTPELRKWYGHVPDRYPEFMRRYRHELQEPEHAAALDRLRDLLRHGPVTLLTATKDPSISTAAVLVELLGGK